MFFGGIAGLAIISTPFLGPVGTIAGLTVSVGDLVGAVGLGALYLQAEETMYTEAISKHEKENESLSERAPERNT